MLDAHTGPALEEIELSESFEKLWVCVCVYVCVRVLIVCVVCVVCGVIPVQLLL